MKYDSGLRRQISSVVQMGTTTAIVARYTAVTNSSIHGRTLAKILNKWIKPRKGRALGALDTYKVSCSLRCVYSLSGVIHYGPIYRLLPTFPGGWKQSSIRSSADDHRTGEAGGHKRWKEAQVDTKNKFNEKVNNVTTLYCLFHFQNNIHPPYCSSRWTSIFEFRWPLIWSLWIYRLITIVFSLLHMNHCIVANYLKMIEPNCCKLSVHKCSLKSLDLVFMGDKLQEISIMHRIIVRSLGYVGCVTHTSN